jgi:hypothetical protein
VGGGNRFPQPEKVEGVVVFKTLEVEDAVVESKVLDDEESFCNDLRADLEGVLVSVAGLE